MDEDEIKPVVWIGDAREQVQSFPCEVRQDIGSALFDVQKGVKPP
jgi:phage-related protein